MGGGLQGGETKPLPLVQNKIFLLRYKFEFYLIFLKFIFCSKKIKFLIEQKNFKNEFNFFTKIWEGKLILLK